jgi:hypothetical protein
MRWLLLRCVLQICIVAVVYFNCGSGASLLLLPLVISQLGERLFGLL